jgi:hypothetical protein
MHAVGSIFRLELCGVRSYTLINLRAFCGIYNSQSVICKKQQMQWSKSGAHLLLQTRVKTLDGELGAIFKCWYPDMDLEVEEMPAAA